MSGLAALYHRDGRPVEERDVWAMLEAVPYRGPDGCWMESWGSVALGFAKRAITPESVGETQPLVSIATGAAIIADIRLDNRAEVMARLPGPVHHAMGDAEVVLRSYECWGLDAFERLLGDFAVVIWDPGEQRVVCARDTSGQRTLFYRLNQHTFAAASEIHQLFQDPSVPVEPDEDRIRDYLVPLNTYQNEKQSEHTFFKGIRAVAPGHVLVVGRDDVRSWPYWTLDPPRELRYRTDEEYAEHYLCLFSDVVEARLRSVHPVGVMLSGGLDSSSIACVAQDLYRSGRAVDHGFASFSTVFDDPSCDERPFIDDIQAKYGFPAHFVSAGSFAGRLQLEPAGFQPSPNMGISEGRDAILGAVHGAGVRALLTGDTADACVAGSPLVFDVMLRKGHLRELRSRLRAYQVTSGQSLLRVLALECAAPLLPLTLQA